MATTAANQAVREARIAALRRFNRFYTQRIGVLQEGLLDSPFSLAQVRVLYELAHPASSGDDGPTASELSARLGVDEGYLSRIVHGFESKGMLCRRPSKADARRQLLALTREGRAAFAPLDRRSHDEAGTLLDALTAGDQRRLVAATNAIERLIDQSTEPRRAIALHAPQTRDNS